jgi:cysteine-rich repeat protein
MTGCGNGIVTGGEQCDDGNTTGGDGCSTTCQGEGGQAISGKKLLLKNTPKFVLLSKDASISIAGSDPVNGADSSVSFDDGSGPVTFTLPASGWSTNGSGTLFKYKNGAAPGGASVVKGVKIKAGLLKVGAEGLPFPVPNGAASIDVVLTLDGGTNTYCMTFTGTGDGNKFLVKDAPAGACP